MAGSREAGRRQKWIERRVLQHLRTDHQATYADLRQRAEQEWERDRNDR